MPSILCIDDDVNYLEFEKSVLEANGYSVLVASDGLTGITLASKNVIDVVVLAFNMPRMNGGQVAEVLFKRQPDLPIVFNTGYFEAMPEAVRWLADACVQKRDGPKVLVLAIQDVVAHKRKSV